MSIAAFNGSIIQSLSMHTYVYYIEYTKVVHLFI